MLGGQDRTTEAQRGEEPFEAVTVHIISPEPVPDTFYDLFFTHGVPVNQGALQSQIDRLQNEEQDLNIESRRERKRISTISSRLQDNVKGGTNQ